MGLHQVWMWSWDWLCGGDSLRAHSHPNKETQQKKSLGQNQVLGISYCREFHKHLMYCLMRSLPWEVCGDGAGDTRVNWLGVLCSFPARAWLLCALLNCLTPKSTNQLAQFHSKDRNPDHLKPVKWIWKVPGCVLIFVPNNDMLFLPWISWKGHWFAS